MMKKLRVFLVAALLVPALFSNASAFTTDSDDALNPSRPRSGWCVFFVNGTVIFYEC